jgi:hypothetical protein
MENFHVQFTAITTQRTGGGTAFMYASSGRQLLDAETNDERNAIIKDFVAKLRSRVPSVDEFMAAFKEIHFTNENTRQRQLVRYLLRRVDEYWRDGAIPDYERLTIEHIAPQRPGGDGGASDLVGSIGNLLLVDGELNDRLSNKTFSGKKIVLGEANVQLDEVLRNAEEWNEKAISKRTEILARLCYEMIFRV